ncbi:hypothetical protein NZD89_02850 [Alicyclobacillus fastidiosus]|uniref:Uncharacterized protein n=1 Tax=Alicyclobacillus fastidiosus TaxID=392011 RepID=A0ABY6ZKN2_9BACL|nr:hypothetical protein [Alicyclobacillus fastidiosus]WAH42455.1 hypothetical protein NZD89_02850 [Alicyclobacillus fastidiosus]
MELGFGMASRLWLKVAVTPVLVSIVYFVLVYVCWHYLGYQGLSSLFGILIFFIKCGAFPIWSSSLVNSVRNHVSNKLITSVTFVLFGAYLIACVYLNNLVYIHASGYFNVYYTGPNRSYETIGVGELLTIILSIVAVLVYIVSFLMIRKNAGHLTKGSQHYNHHD